MNATYKSCEILQVTRGQCPLCRVRSVFSVLVAESPGAADEGRRRTFYTCERTLIPRRYYAHECQGKAAGMQHEGTGHPLTASR